MNWEPKLSGMNKNKNVVVVGGGTGSYVVLCGLRRYPVNLTAIVSVTDSGGSTGRLRTEFGFLPVGDMRQCLAALADSPNNSIQKLLLYRFNKGKGLTGHNLGNLILTALTDITKSESQAVAEAAKIFRLQGSVIPVSEKNVQLQAIYEDGSIITGEHEIDEPKHRGGKRILDIQLKPKAEINPETIKALVKADLIIVGPGDLYTSILPNCLVSGFKEIIKKTKAKIIYIVNIMTRFSQTDKYSGKDHVDEVAKYIGKYPDYVFINNGMVPKNISSLYLKEKGFPVADDLLHFSKSKIIRKNFLKATLVKKNAGDKLKRSFIRHDSEKLAEEIFALLK